jgi:uncharacterized HAD superfamily protein
MTHSNLLKTAFDIDGVVCHTWKIILDLINEGRHIPFTEDDLTKYDLRTVLDIAEEEFRGVIAKSLSREYMDKKPIEEEAVTSMFFLHKITGKTIPFITSRKEPEDTIYYLDNYIVKGQFPYIVRHGSWDDGLTAWDRKLIQIQELGCIAMVEDAPETLQTLLLHNIVPILIDRPYNQYCTWALRFTDWRAVFNLALALEKI